MVFKITERAMRHCGVNLKEMGIRGLWTYIESSGGNLSVYELHNQPLVIDAENFATACYREAALQCEFGGEYLAFKSYVQSLLKEFSICGVEPIFVFGGCHPKEGTKLDTLMKRNKEYFKQLSSALLIAKSTCSTELNIDIAPRLNRNVLVEILRESSIRYIACEREADISTAELAVHLQCPVTSGDSDFFIYRPNDNNQAYHFIPFSTVSRYSKKRSVPCSICKRSGAPCYVMSCSILNNSGPFSKLKYPMLPLFAILVGNDMISNIRLPTIIDSLIRTSKLQRKSYYQRRIDAIFNWLLSFRDIEEPLSLVLSLYEENERDGIEETIRLGISDYVLSSSGENLARELGFSTEHNISSSVSLSSKMGNLSIQDPTTYRGSYCEDASKFSKPIFERNDEDSMFHRWPKELIRRFRFLDLIPSLFDHMYVRNGAFSRLLMEDIKIPNSLNECMSKMRSAINGLIYGLENHLGTNGKLCGMENECVIEYRRNLNGDFTKTLMSMKPLKPPSAETPGLSFLSFFSKLFNVNLEKDFKPLEIQGLGILLILWFRCSSHAQNEAKNIKTSPVALALSCCTIAMNSNREFLGRNRDVDGDFANFIRTHLDKCADVAKSNCCQEVNKRSFCIEQVHQLNELQSMATGLKHLVAMIEVLCPFYMSNSNKFDSCSHFRNPFISFYPFWMLFASGRLLYWISRLLQNIDPSERFHKVMNEWLPKLLIRTNSGREQEGCASKDLTKLFNLIDKLNS
ncbi:unnamed protein product [Schistosoma curassoni]|nr:unnamed protein product [Schistosoma curassoni]